VKSQVNNVFLRGGSGGGGGVSAWVNRHRSRFFARCAMFGLNRNNCTNQWPPRSAEITAGTPPPYDVLETGNAVTPISWRHEWKTLIAA